MRSLALARILHNLPIQAASYAATPVTIPNDPKTPSWKRAWGLAALLSVLHLAVSLAPSVRPLLMESYSSYAINAVLGADEIGSTLLLDLGGFLAACVLLHLLLGAGAVTLTWASEQARVSQPVRRLGVCFLWYAAMAVGFVLWSAATYPQSHAAADYGAVADVTVLGQSPATLWAVGVCAAALGVLMTALWRTQGRILRRSLGPALLAAGAAAITVGFVHGQPVARAAEQGRPHVIILGIDSLRPDLLRQMMESGRLPNLAAFASDAAWFPDTTTPLARTYPAWVSILTGRAPTACAIVCNLMPRDEVALAPTLPGELRRHGYRSVLATDEVRFSNIDETYGFDTLLTPTIGAAEFLISRMSDLPVLNAVVNWRIAEPLFPQVYGNRAVAHVYRPDTFVRRLRDGVDFDRPTFLAVHLTLPHWPYLMADSQVRDHSSGGAQLQYDRYLEMLEAADRQFGDIRAWLDAEGVLRNAIVVVLSDHGEALRRPGDSLLEGVADPAIASLRVGRTGHGTSVMSAVQFQVFLGFSAHGLARGKVVPGARPEPAALEDVAPTLMDMLAIAPSGPYDGYSLASVVAGQPGDRRLVERVRFTETGFNLPRLLAGDINPDWIAMRAAGFYRLNPRTGYLELRPSKLPMVNSMKERAAIHGGQLLAALPNASGGQTFVLVSRAGGEARQVDSLDDDPVLAPMWAAMVGRFGDDLASLGAAAAVEPGT